jgi:hypothetical protein
VRLVICAALAVTLIASPAHAAAQPHAAAQSNRHLPAAEVAAVRLANRDGMATGIGVVDTTTGALYARGESTRMFASASVVKTLIATRLILRGKLHGHNESLAHIMITGSDNDAAQKLYPKVGGDRLVPLLEKHYQLRGLGAPATTPGVWGSTQLTAAGMAEFYAAIRHDHRVWPWLSRAMHAYHATSTEGEPNTFGVAAAAPKSAVKNGWVLDHEPDKPVRTQIDSTGFVDHDRYAVAIFSRGATSMYYRAGERVVSDEAKLVVPHGHVTPLPRPWVRGLSHRRGSVGDKLTIAGAHFRDVRAVYFDNRAKMLSTRGRRIQVIAPRHSPGIAAVTVKGAYGTSRRRRVDHFRYVSTNRPGVRSDHDRQAGSPVHAAR